MLTAVESEFIARQYPAIRRRLRGGLRKRGITANPDALNESATWFCRMFASDSLRRNVPLLASRVAAAVWYAVERVGEHRPSTGCLREDAAHYIDAIAPEDTQRRRQELQSVNLNCRAAAEWRLCDVGRAA